MPAQLHGMLVTPQGLQKGSIHFDKTIEALEPHTADGPYILPGFIDTHVHGGGGGDAMDGANGVIVLAKFHLRHGTTTLYPTTMTNPWEKIIAALKGIAEVQQRHDPNLPDIPGAHLEGPFISPKRLGAQPAFTLEPNSEYVNELLELNIIKVLTIAPEVPQALEAAVPFAQAGIRVSIGHTAASYDLIQRFIQELQTQGGTIGFTHLYNAMGGLQGRDPGVVGAALANHSCFAELIFDLHHVHPASFLTAFNAKPKRLSFVSDSIRANGLAEGETELGGHRVFVKEGMATLADGTLAGSVLTLDQALRNALEIGVTLEQASSLLSEVPASYMGLKDRGSLEPGKRADLVILDDDFRVLEVYVAGKKVAG